jgi:hypothetical protein
MHKRKTQIKHNDDEEIIICITSSIKICKAPSRLDIHGYVSFSINVMVVFSDSSKQAENSSVVIN